MNSNRHGKILVVDDDRLVLATLAHGLSQAGYDVIDADNGDDAILLAREHQPQLALLDIRMQGKSGFDVAAYLRDHSDVPFMFLSAFADEQTAAQVKALGAVAYLVKPLDIGQILPVVDAAFASLYQAAASAAASAPAATEAAPAPAGAKSRAAEPPLPAPEVLIALGVLMQQFSLDRVAAYERLSRLAAAEGVSLDQKAVRVLDAVEQHARPAQA